MQVLSVQHIRLSQAYLDQKENFTKNMHIAYGIRGTNKPRMGIENQKREEGSQWA